MTAISELYPTLCFLSSDFPRQHDKDRHLFAGLFLITIYFMNSNKNCLFAEHDPVVGPGHGKAEKHQDFAGGLPVP